MLIYVNANVMLQRCREEVFCIMHQLLMSVDAVGACCQLTLTVMMSHDSAVDITCMQCVYHLCPFVAGEFLPKTLSCCSSHRNRAKY